MWSAFEAAFLATDNRANGLRVRIGGETSFIVDHVGATRTFTVEPTFSFIPAAGDLIDIAADIPLLVSEVMLIAPSGAGANLLFNEDQAGVIGNGVYNTILVGQAHMLVDDEQGTPGHNIYVAGSGGTSTLELRVKVP
jgi:hypothetical protein